VTPVHPPLSGRPRLLFIAEAVTLAHVTRLLALALGLDFRRYDVRFACHPRYASLYAPVPFPVHDIYSIPTTRFLEALANGDPFYDAATLRRYVREDLALLESLAPAVVIGDFRLSLSVSARVAGIPYLAVANAHWSPYARPRFVLPELPLTRRLGMRLGQLVFDCLRPLIFARHARPLNRVRRDYGLPPVGRGLPQLISDGDRTLYADLPELVPTFHRPPGHRYAGPILWSAHRRPAWWNRCPQNRTTVYVTFGTSGHSELLSLILDALAELGCTALVATAGRADGLSRRSGTWVAAYLPGIEAAERAGLVVCNGGSATVYQGLAAGTPVLGIPGNLDQSLTMDYLRKAGAGEPVRAGEVTGRRIKQMVSRLLHQPPYRGQAQRLRAYIKESRPIGVLEEVIEEFVKR
jgi:UDP:flavonoid glycosyltransferase YjiC (YdhE family)